MKLTNYKTVLKMKIFILFLNVKVKEGDCATHFIVMFRNRFFKCDAFNAKNQQALNINELYHMILNSIINKYASKSDGAGIGALTADHREKWAQVHLSYLLE